MLITGASFQLPGDLSELERPFLERVLVCIQVFPSFLPTPFIPSLWFLLYFLFVFNKETSLIDSDTSQGDVSAAFFTFYTMNCATGEREEVVLTIDREFLIYLPLPADYKNEVKKKNHGHMHTQT